MIFNYMRQRSYIFSFNIYTEKNGYSTMWQISYIVYWVAISRYSAVISTLRVKYVIDLIYHVNIKCKYLHGENKNSGLISWYSTMRQRSYIFSCNIYTEKNGYSTMWQASYIFSCNI